MLDYEAFKKELFESVCSHKWVKDNGISPFIGFEYNQEYLSSRKSGMFLSDSPVLLLKDLFENYEETHTSIREYADRAVFFLQGFYEKMENWLKQPKEILNKSIFFAVVPSSKLYRNCISIEVFGLNVAFGFKVNDDIDMFITWRMMRQLGYSIEQIQFLSLKNTPLLFPAKIIDSADLRNGNDRVILVSNTAGKYGVSTILYPNLLNSMPLTAGGRRGFFVFPYDENCIALTGSYPDNESAPWDEPRKVLNFKEPGRFCDNIYYFDPISKKLKLARNSEKKKTAGIR